MDYIKHIEDSIKWANLEVSKLNNDILNIHGVTSNKVKIFLNNICNIDYIKYLEIGVFRGATFCSALYNNNIKGVAIDNWSSPYLLPNGVSQKIDFFMRQKTDDPKQDFLTNVGKFTKPGAVSAFRTDYLTFDFTPIGNVDIVFYDGETKYNDQYTTIKNILPLFNDNGILIIDDWNWHKDSVTNALKDTNTCVLYEKFIITKGEDMKDFWNGLGIFLISK